MAIVRVQYFSRIFERLSRLINAPGRYLNPLSVKFTSHDEAIWDSWEYLRMLQVGTQNSWTLGSLTGNKNEKRLNKPLLL